MEVTGVVRDIAPGHLFIDGFPEPEIDMGTTVIVHTGPVTLMISERQGMAGNHPEIYRAFGIESAEYQMAVLKTASNFQWFASITSRVIRVDTPGPTQSDIAGLPWARQPRPAYPLDIIDDWRG